ncbi:MAG: DUF5777 family beta-barrel protein [Bacteroidota bacterium]
MIFCCYLWCSSQSLSAQDEDLLAILEEEPTRDFVMASFKTNRVINLHSLENTAKGVLDFKIGHRFGFLSGGFYELFGLDNATIRLGLDYGLTDQWTIGLGRSSFEKTYDGFVKYKFLRQSTGKINMPITAAFFTSIAINGLRWENPNRDHVFSQRLAYTFQLIVGRKFNKLFSLQLSPTLVHRNLVETEAEANDVFSLAAAARLKITKRMTINAEYLYTFPDQLATEFTNAFSIGIDLETGGHVFQLHFTNATAMVEKGFFTETTGRWQDGDIHFGFNVSRVFTIVKAR